jgi:PAP2 superfamily
MPAARTIACLLLLGVAAVEVASAIFGGIEPHRVAVRMLGLTPGWSLFAYCVAVASPPLRVTLFKAALILSGLGLAVDLAQGLAGAQSPIWWAGLGLGASPLVCLGWAFLRSGRREAALVDQAAAASVLYLSSLMMPFFLFQTTQWFPTVMDPGIAFADEALAGFQPSGLLALAFAKSDALRVTSSLVYGFLPVAVAAVAGFEARSGALRDAGVLSTFLIAALLGYACYALMPTIGPRAFFGEAFPLMNASAAFLESRPRVDFDPTHFRNAVPSLHVTWAALALLACRGRSMLASVLMSLFLAFTILATLGLGEHYLVDLVVAAPFLLVVRAASSIKVSRFSPERLGGLVVGSALLALWAWHIRSGSLLGASSAFVTVFSLVTVGLSAWLELTLFRAEKRMPGAAPLAAPETPLSEGVKS